MNKIFYLILFVLIYSCNKSKTKKDTSEKYTDSDKENSEAVYWGIWNVLAEYEADFE